MNTSQWLVHIGIVPLAIVSIIIAMITISEHVVKYPNKTEKLLLLQVIFANGEQDSLPFIPQSSSDADIYWLNESSVLSLQGQKRAFKLGKAIKNIYQLYLQNYDFSYDLVYSSTGYLNILQATLQCVHAGLFPTFPGAQIINVNLDWRPVPYEVYPKNDDIYIYQTEVLKTLRDLRVNGQNDSMYETQLKKTLDVISNIIKFNASLSDVVMINDYLNIQNKFRKLSNEWNEIWPGDTTALVNEFWKEFASHAQPSAVPLLNVFLENIKKKIANELPTARKLHLFSAHRLSLVEILSGLESWDILNGTITPCSYILLEMVQEFATVLFWKRDRSRSTTTVYT
ncbi:venom acid phosphatase Acph-1-like isoform X2 [Atheta coriaria]|uniref:venom acid phosphatase Acph-1-like isoform X2 n=1 Tax=Dalotia coriaria TaxID=877792 RepID=UPI0031F3C1A3